MSPQRISVIVPVYNEADNIRPCLERLWSALHEQEHEILVCYDYDADLTLSAIAAMQNRPPTLRLVKNDLGPGVAFALRAGFQAATGDVIVTTMADLSDPPEVIPLMADKIRREGADVVSGSRYMRGGSQHGGPLLKRLLSRAAGLSLHWLAGIQTYDATNNFRAYRREFLRRMPVASEHGFEVGLELTVKAHLQRFRVAEVPSSWVDRSAGHSRFRLWHWLPHYLRWYGAAIAAPALVWTVWLAMVVAAFAFVAHYGSDVPLSDEWANVPYMTGHAPITAQWLWSQHNEHRIPLPRLIEVGLVRLTGGDFRAPLFFDLACLSVVAFAFIVTVRRLQGRMYYSDALFPFALLHWGHAENLLWSFQVTFIGSVTLLSTILLVLLRPVREMRLLSFVLLALCLPVLLLFGGTGLAMTPALALWLGCAGVASWHVRSKETERFGPALLVMTIVACGLLASFYIVGYQQPAYHPPSPGLGATLLTTAECLSMGVGPAGKLLWPFSAYFMIGVYLLTVSLLTWQWIAIPQERIRTLGLLLGLAALVSLSLAVGHGRAGLGVGAGHMMRYAILASPVLCLAYVTWTLYAPSRLGRLARWSLFAVIVAVFPLNLREGRVFARFLQRVMMQFHKDVWEGRTPAELAVRYQILYPDVQALALRLKMLQEVGYGPFRLTAEQRQAALRELYRKLYSMLNTVPDNVHSDLGSSGVEPRRVDGEKVLLVHAPGRMRFRVAPGDYHLTGRFGLLPGAYVQGKTDGVVFRVTTSEKDRQTAPLFERFLNPFQVAGDQGMHSLAVEFRVITPTDVVLETLPGPADNSHWDWSYWTQVRIEPAMAPE